MLNSLVAVVLGNALVASLFALGVVLLARWYHKPALLHGLWVVVLLKLVTPPMITIPVPVEMSALVSEPAVEANPSQILESTLADIPAEPPDRPGRFALPVEQHHTVVIENFTNPGMVEDEDEYEADPSFSDPFGPMQGMPAENAVSFTQGEIDPQQCFGRGKFAGFGSRGISRRLLRCRLDAEATSQDWQFSWRTVWQAMLWVWGTGAVAVFLIAVRQIVQFECSLQHAEPAGEALRDWVRRLAGQVGLNRAPDVYLLGGAVSPMLWGFGRRPRLLLPKELLARLE